MGGARDLWENRFKVPLWKKWEQYVRDHDLATLSLDNPNVARARDLFVMFRSPLSTKLREYVAARGADPNDPILHRMEGIFGLVKLLTELPEEHLRNYWPRVEQLAVDQ